MPKGESRLDRRTKRRGLTSCRDFTQTQIVQDFYESLEGSLEGKSGEGSIYMGRSHAHLVGGKQPLMGTGTSLRELVHKFRHKTLIMLKMLLLQKRASLEAMQPDPDH